MKLLPVLVLACASSWLPKAAGQTAAQCGTFAANLTASFANDTSSCSGGNATFCPVQCVNDLKAATAACVPGGINLGNNGTLWNSTYYKALLRQITSAGCINAANDYFWSQVNDCSGAMYYTGGIYSYRLLPCAGNTARTCSASCQQEVNKTVNYCSATQHVFVAGVSDYNAVFAAMNPYQLMNSAVSYYGNDNISCVGPNCTGSGPCTVPFDAPTVQSALSPGNSSCNATLYRMGARFSSGMSCGSATGASCPATCATDLDSILQTCTGQSFSYPFIGGVPATFSFGPTVAVPMILSLPTGPTSACASQITRKLALGTMRTCEDSILYTLGQAYYHLGPCAAPGPCSLACQLSLNATASYCSLSDLVNTRVPQTPPMNMTTMWPLLQLGFPFATTCTVPTYLATLPPPPAAALPSMSPANVSGAQGSAQPAAVLIASLLLALVAAAL